MPLAALRPDALLPALQRSDAARPRITCYDDDNGERIELSARVLANWVNKAANLLQDEFGAEPGTRVALDLPPHWRTLYWALAAWAVGATVVTDGSGGDVVVTDRPGATGPQVVVTRGALARAAAIPVPPGAVDEARDLPGQPDVFDAWDAAGDQAAALVTPAGTRPYAAPTGAAIPAGARVHTATGDTAEFLDLALATLAGDGSVVLSIGEPSDLPARLRAEAVTLER